MYNVYGQCRQCKQGYSLSGSNCVPRNCANINNKYDSSMGCLGCPNGFEYQSGRCYPSRQPNCVMYSGTQCTLCQFQFHMANSNTSNLNINNISTTNKVCEPIVPNCQLMNSTTNRCQTCADKYVFYRGTCILEIPDCADYTFTGLCSRCLQLPTRKYQLSPNGTCVKVPTRCAQLNEFDACEECDIGYTMVSGECVILRENCQSYDNLTGRCFKCEEGGYWLKNGYCFFVIPYCAHTDLASKRCHSCVDDYVVSKDGFCVIQDDHCTAHKYGECVKCRDLYYLQNGRCVANPTNCIVYKDGKCQLCSSDSLLLPDTHICISKAMLSNGCTNFDTTTIRCAQCSE